MAQFVGLDVSIKETSICVVDETGIVLWEGRRASEPSVLARAIRRYAPDALRVGLETGPTSAWHWHGLHDLGVSIICIDARHAKAALSMRLNKSDKNDARGLAEIMRTGWYREVKVKSLQSHGLQALLGARARLVKVRHELANQIRAILMGAGMRAPSSRGRGFADHVEAIVREHDWLAPLIEPLVLVWRGALEQVSAMDRRIGAVARTRPDCRRLMTVLGVGTIVSLAFVSAIDDPKRFTKSSSVGAYVGLTPRRYQSGDVDRTGRISKCGDRQLRTYLYEAALVVLFRVQKWSALKAWGMRILKRSGVRKAAVAIARKLAVLMHAMLAKETDFRWSNQDVAA
ncbi:MAG: IS110 family transposase [Hyphomicrobiales bacterium]